MSASSSRPSPPKLESTKWRTEPSVVVLLASVALMVLKAVRTDWVELRVGLSTKVLGSEYSPARLTV